MTGWQSYPSCKTAGRLVSERKILIIYPSQKKGVADHESRVVPYRGGTRCYRSHACVRPHRRSQTTDALLTRPLRADAQMATDQEKLEDPNVPEHEKRELRGKDLTDYLREIQKEKTSAALSTKAASYGTWGRWIIVIW